MRGLLLSARICGFAIALLMGLTGVVLVSPSTSLATGLCPNEAFRVGPSAALPDCRAYEMVTPPFKNAGDVTNESAIVSSEPMVGSDGQELTIWSTASFAGATGNTNDDGSPYILSRTESGWTATSMELSESQFLTFGLDNFAEPTFGGSLDGQTEALMARGVSQPGNSITVYRTGADGSIVEVGPALPPTAPYLTPETLASNESGGAGMTTAGMSADGSDVFFSTTFLHWPFDETGEGWQDLYEYSGTGNTEPLLVGVNNDGKLISECGTFLGGTDGAPELNTAISQTEMDHNAISADGSTVFFTAEKPGFFCGLPSPPADEVFARIDNGLPDAHTVAISEPTHEDCEECNTSEPANAIFEGASEDGSKVFFSTEQALLGSDRTQNLYEYDFDAPAGHKLIRVSGGEPALSNPTAGVIEEPAAISEDGSHVYFGATGVLTRTPNSQGQLAHAGAMNLYVFERDAQYPAGHTAFIGGLAPGDGELFSRSKILSGAHPRGAFTTPDGRFLVFRSEADLTPDDTSTVPQIFEYDTQTESLVRVSVGQDGFNDDGNTSVYPAEIPSPLANFKKPEHADPRAYWSHMATSADGSYVFFTSRAALAPGAIEEQSYENNNGEQVYVDGPNVYEYHEGNVYLIAKASKTPEPLIGTDVSGQDVFITTTEQLVAQDTDTDGDIYDARIGGGFPAPVTAPGCSGDACQGPLSGAPVLLSPGSEFQAGGNPPLASTQPAVKSVVKKKAKPKSKKKKAKKKAKKSDSRRARSTRRRK